jgi:1-aminocyclopropane-1-carboxylate deaminase/D-cysteine desulfhydrase-like pyridoxal-dependent ACC family enzyme
MVHTHGEMSVLPERWSRLRSLPHVSLGTLPTPLERSTRLTDALDTEVWAKRDDLTGARYGGNKVRKLERLLGDALDRGADTIITTGAAGSHHVLATSLYGRSVGLAVHGVMVPQKRTPHVEANLRATVESGAILHAVPVHVAVAPAMAALALRLRREGHRPYLIGPGGSEPAGVVGYVEGGLELAEQLLSIKNGQPDAIYVALGSGGTACGLALGLAAAGAMMPVIAVRVTPRGVVRRAWLASLARGAARRLRSFDDRFPDVTDLALANLSIDDAELGRGYGVPTPSGREAGRLAHDVAGLDLDATYTEKAFASLVRAARGPRRGQRLLFVQTLSSVHPPQSSDALPARIASLIT